MENKAESAADELPDPDLKIILLGDSAVGKSKLIERYLMDEYNPRQVCQPNIITFITRYVSYLPTHLLYFERK